MKMKNFIACMAILTGGLSLVFPHGPAPIMLAIYMVGYAVLDAIDKNGGRA